ncbi:hypothetical protein Bca52824_088407 [Brassica carinata]|uniref:RING-type E3 ubiquitin transferase n=1 Tax=Brassica carinata TaxID=52824 RepID=A0A8X7PA13_BRACI|nr:hypothetical protein Bca52824_088407 [Brassica carinata]
MKIKRPSTQHTKIVIFVAMKTTSSGHLIHETVRDMEYMLGYHKIYFDSDGDYRAMPDLSRHLDIIVKISDYNPDTLHRIDLDVYIIELRENRREPTPSEKDDICSICCEEFGTEGDINSLNCKHSYHYRCILDWVGKTLTCPCCRAILA